ncbi:hypothetical protein M0805_006302 [Coniferiporia weirii]|nr:hypothetical protein M0805_006302 [Coniferiporia weirii]
MSSPKQLSLARANDLVLGAFSKAPMSEGLDHAVRYLSTWSGSEYIVQYALKIIIPFLDLRARLQHRTGMRKETSSSASPALSTLYGMISNSRMLWRFWGLLPIYQWLTSLERVSPPTRELLTIERIQGLSMLLYYPLEHLYYLRANGLLPATVSLSIPFLKSFSVRLNATKLALWSTRAWALYVFLQFAHLREDARLLKLRQRALSRVRGRGNDEVNAEKVEVARRWDALGNELVANLGNLPLTIHWSLENGLFKNDIWVGIFGLVAGLASFRSGWQATALPSAPPSIPSPSTAAAPAAGAEPPASSVGADEKEPGILASPGELSPDVRDEEKLNVAAFV